MTGLLNTVPPSLPSGAAYDARLRRKRATITLATQTTSDTIVIAKRNKGEIFAFGVHTTDTSLGSSTVAIGITGTTGKYRTAATYTATNTPTMFGNVAVIDDDAATTEETIFITIAAANFPASGIYVVDLYFSAT
jgi:hypothetical protein